MSSTVDEVARVLFLVGLGITAPAVAILVIADLRAYKLPERVQTRIWWQINAGFTGMAIGTLMMFAASAGLG